MLGILVGVSALVAAMTLVLKLGPHYIDFQTMQTIFKALPESEVHTMSKGDIYEALGRRFKVNSLRDFDIKDIVSIERQKTGTLVTVAYERRADCYEISINSAYQRVRSSWISSAHNM